MDNRLVGKGPKVQIQSFKRCKGHKVHSALNLTCQLQVFHLKLLTYRELSKKLTYLWRLIRKRTCSSLCLKTTGGTWHKAKDKKQLRKLFEIFNFHPLVVNHGLLMRLKTTQSFSLNATM